MTALPQFISKLANKIEKNVQASSKSDPYNLQMSLYPLKTTQEPRGSSCLTSQDDLERFKMASKGYTVAQLVDLKALRYLEDELKFAQ